MTKNLGLMVFGLLIALVILEALVRLAGAKPETYLRKFSKYHPILGWEKTPNMEGYFRRGDVMIHEKLNSKGLRDHEYTYEKPNEIHRILVLGDSFTEGYDVEFEDLFTEVLERLLNDSSATEAHRRYEVINAGTGGYSTDQEYLFFHTEGYKYQPDLVILMVYAANDIYYNAQDQYGNYSKPLFAFRNDSLTLTNVPLPEPPAGESLKNLARETALYPIITKIVLQQMPSAARFLQKLGLISKSTLDVAVTAREDSAKTSYPPSFSIYEIEYDEATKEAWAMTEALIGQLRVETGRAGAELWICSVPDRFQVYEADWKRTQSRYRVDDRRWMPSKPDSLLRSICSRYGLAFLDLTPSLRASTGPLYNGVHWNEAGNREVASVLYRAVIHQLKPEAP